MSSLSRELVFLILQFLDEEKFKETVHKLEQESGFFFNMKYFEDQVQDGQWDEVERYLAGFTKVDDNRYSMKIFFEIRKQKYLEALDKQDRAKAVEILVKDLKVFANFNEDLYKEITQLLTLDNFRENEQLSKYGDTKSARNIMLLELKKLIEANPLFREKLQFPSLKASRLRTLINQSLNWQHQLCKNPRSNPDIKTLFVDHTCGPAPAGGGGSGGGSRVQAPPANSALLSTAATKPAPSPFALGVGVGVGPHPVLALLKRPRTPPTSQGGPGPAEYQGPGGGPGGGEGGEHVMKRSRQAGQPEEVRGKLPLAMHPWPAAAAPLLLLLCCCCCCYCCVLVPLGLLVQASGGGAPYSIDELPKTVSRVLTQGSCVMSMDFHPYQQTLLLVGTNSGDVGLWEVGSREKLAERPFKVWYPNQCSVQLQTALVKDPLISVNRVIWEPDGQLLGAAFSKHIVHIYMYQGQNHLAQHLEIDAHAGGVNDLAFSHPNKQACVITCGDDKTIKVWDATTGRKHYTFEGHEAPVYSVCPHHKENIQIKAWLYDHMGSRVDYDAPGRWCTTMAYSADGTRWAHPASPLLLLLLLLLLPLLLLLFLLLLSTFFLFPSPPPAAAAYFYVHPAQLVENRLASPRLRFNKEGSLLAVTAGEKDIKVLANEQGMRLLRHYEARAPEPVAPKLPPVTISTPIVIAPVPVPTAALPPQDRASPATAAQQTPPVNPNGVESTRNVDVKPRAPPQPKEAPSVKSPKMAEVLDASQCRTCRLPDSLTASKISRLIFTNSGVSLLALASNAVHKLWKWQRNERNLSGKATASVLPQLWQPASGIMMTNDVSKTAPEDAVPCIALSKNDSYVMSASGGKVSLFNMLTFKVMTTFMSPPPAATFLAFHPLDNNIIAIGMEDSTIQIYNVRLDEVKSKLKGHQKRITGLAFSNTLNVLVSSGADAQVCLWGTDGWERRKTISVASTSSRNGPAGGAGAGGDTRVQFHNDQMRLLVVHEAQLAIYDANKLERSRQWAPRESGALSAPISAATYSCDSQLVFAGFLDGSVCVFDADTLRPRCRIAPSVYVPSTASTTVYPLVIAAHPSEPHQIALGLSDGGVQVIEPAEGDNKWGGASLADHPAGNAAGAPPASGANSSQAAEQPPAR
eukprot:jgi/Mesen1/1193/ME000128S00169